MKKIKLPTKKILLRVLSVVLPVLAVGIPVFLLISDVLLNKPDTTGMNVEWDYSFIIPKRICVYLPAASAVDESAAQRLSDALNARTEPDMHAHLCLHFVPDEEYDAVIRQKLAEQKDYRQLKEQWRTARDAASSYARKNKITADGSFWDAFYAEHPEYSQFRNQKQLYHTDTADYDRPVPETEVIPSERYPELEEIHYVFPDELPGQCDIFLLRGYDEMTELADSGALYAWHPDEISRATAQSYQPSQIEFSKYKGTYYGIPGNVSDAPFTYLLLRRDLTEKYNYTADPPSSPYEDAFYRFLSDVAAYEPDTVPFLGDLPLTNVQYFSFDAVTGKAMPEKFSLLGTVDGGGIPECSEEERKSFRVGNLFENEAFVCQLRAIAALREAGLLHEETAETVTGKNFAARVVRAGPEIAEEYGEDYDLVILEYPRLTESNGFSSVLAISAYSDNRSWCVEVLKKWITDPFYADTLRYGVEGTDWEEDEDGNARLLRGEYRPALGNAGNLFCGHFPAGTPANAKQNAIAVNTGLRSGYFAKAKIDLSSLLFPEHAETFAKVSETLSIQLRNVRTVAEADAMISEACALCPEEIALSVQDIPGTLWGAYCDWLRAEGYLQEIAAE